MSMMAHSVEDKVDALLAVLDDDIRHTEFSIEKLGALRTFLVKRDDAALEQLLRELQEQGQAQSERERCRLSIRLELGQALGDKPQNVTLSTLRKILPEPQRTAVKERQMKLKLLVRRLNSEYRLTHALLMNCARFNQSMMRVFFGSKGGHRTTYNAIGRAKNQTEASLINLHY